jgi:hypothetical protein
MYAKVDRRLADSGRKLVFGRSFRSMQFIGDPRPKSSGMFEAVSPPLISNLSSRGRAQATALS